jgi:DNA-binding CsgD family transcriptional regulator
VLFGRDAERALIGALLDAARDSRSGALALRGEAGVGKTVLLEDARGHAGDMHVLTARGVESESELPFAVLHQLLRPALRHVDRLPAPQAAALKSAFGLADGGGQERFLIYSACLSLLSELAEERPVLCLVDDAHWLDAGSSDALQFVARRLDAEGVVLLFGAREGDVRSFEAPDVPSHTVGGLDDAAAAELLAHAAASAAPRVRERLLEQTHGNALALVELPTALTAAQLAGDEPLPEALPMTRRLELVFHDRVARLPAPTRLALLAAAADDSESAAVVERAVATLSSGAFALAAAEQAGLLTIDGGRVTFRHPLVRSAVYGAATSTERRAVHWALAAAMEGDDEQADRRAWHLASSALEPDEGIVRALDEAAERAVERGGHGAAAKALERAAALSADRGERARRLARAAVLTSLSGRDAPAVALAEQAVPLSDDPRLRAQCASVQGIAALRSGRPRDTLPALVAAAGEVAPVDAARAADLLMMATSCAWLSADRSSVQEIARITAAVIAPTGDEVSAFFAGVISGFAAMMAGDHAEASHKLERAIAHGALTDVPRHAMLANLAAIWLGDDEAAAALARRSIALARARGEVGSLAEALAARSAQLILAQRNDEAEVAAREAAALARELSAENILLLLHAVLGIIAAIQGRHEESHRYGEQVLAVANAKGLPNRAALATYALAIDDVNSARWTEALERFETMAEQGTGDSDPVMAALMLPDKLEAAVRAGELGVARTALAQFEGWATHAGARFAAPRLAGCRALLAEGDDATEHFEEMLRLADEARPLDLGRMRMYYGEHLRRERRRSAARTQFRAALATFEAYHAEPLAERARAALRATGETARKRDPSTIDQLTPQELQIARFVASGRSNKEVAAQLFLSPRTVDAHLRKVFSKLGITSRTQLAREPLGDVETVAEPSFAQAS